jgi:hypothetical protein
MTLGDVSTREHPQHLFGKLEQAEAIRDGRLRPADPLGDVSEGQLELVDERGVGARLLDGGQLLASDVLDEAEEQRVAILDVADDRRQRRHSGSACSAPAPLTGDELEPALAATAYDDGLKHAL